jgi:excisionase family DNA binding protein
MNPTSRHQPEETDNWLSLKEASAILGVATSTLRRWSSSGRVPMQRIGGRHQRFPRTAIMQLAKAPQTSMALAFKGKLARQDGHARGTAGQLTDRAGGLGQRLLGLLMRYINQRDDDARYLIEARGVGERYGLESQLAGVSLHDTVKALLFFRSTFSQLAMPIPGIAQPADLAESAGLLARIERIMDTMLLGVIAGFEQR